MDRWTSPPVLEPWLDLLVLPSLSISEMRKIKMCCFSLTTFSDSPKHALRYLLFLVESHQLSVINQLLLPILVNFKKELPPPSQDLLHQYKLSTYQQMILLIQLQPQHSHILMLQLCCPELWPNWVSIQLSIHLIQPQECLLQKLSDKSIMIAQEVSRNLSRITNPFKILLLFWVWMSCLKKIDLPSLEPERLRSSSHNLSKWLKCSLVCQEDSPSSLIPLKVSNNSSEVLVMTIQNNHSTWLVDSRKPSRRVERLRLMLASDIDETWKINDRFCIIKAIMHIFQLI